MHFPDLSPYVYGVAPPGDDVALNVGWLAIAEPFTVGRPPPGFVDALRRLTRAPAAKTRGYHWCEYCLADLVPPTDPAADRRSLHREMESRNALGNGEILVRGSDGTIYHAPVMIAHYVVDHAYLPPEEFVTAVLDT